jgi:signal transduction histidine kinase
MRALTSPRSVLVAPTVLFVAAWLAFPLPEDVRTATMDVAWFLVAAAAGWCAWRASRSRANRHLRASLQLIAAASLAWAIGQALWTYFEVVAGTDPFPSLADPFFLLTPPLLAAALVAWPGGALHRRPLHEWIAPAILALLASIAGYELLVEPLIATGGGFDVWLSLAYPVADLVLIAGVVLALGLREVAERERLLTVASGILALLVADAAWQRFAESAVARELANGAFTLAFVLVGAACLLQPTLSRRRLATASEGGIGTFVALLIGLVMIKELVEDLENTTSLEAADSFGYGVVVVALVWLSWKAVRMMQRTQDALTHESTLRAATMEASRTGNCLFTVDGDAAFRNGAFAEILGLDALAPVTWASFVSHLQSIARENESLAIAAAPGQSVRCWTTHGRFVELRIEEIVGGEILVSVDDLTHQQREAATRARFVAEIVGAQEAEARRIAGLLHDDAVQQLTALALRLDLAAMKSGDDSLGALAESANGVTASLRSLLVQLHPAVLESQGLRAAIEVAAAPLRGAGVRVAVAQHDERHGIEIEQLAYRLVQEAFANALKHAHATDVRVQIERRGADLRVSVTDNGCGFDLAELSTAVASGHLGLQLLQERVDLAGGTVEIVSAPGRGTTVAFAVPLFQTSLAEEIAA